jgi:hypothetical protein
MLLWNLELLMPFNDIFEVLEPPTKVLAVQTRSRGEPVSNDLTISQTLRGKKHLITRKNLLSPKEIL